MVGDAPTLWDGLPLNLQDRKKHFWPPWWCETLPPFARISSLAATCGANKTTTQLHQQCTHNNSICATTSRDSDKTSSSSPFICKRQAYKQVIWAKLMRRATALAVPICRLPWFNSIHFDAIHSWNLRRSHKLQKNTKTPILEIQGHLRSSMFTPIKSLSPYCLLL